MPTEPQTNDFRRTALFTLAIAAVAVACKVVPRYVLDPTDSFFWNLVPMGAVALFAGSRLRTRYAYLVPVAAMFLGDLLLIPALAAKGYSSFSPYTPLIYASFALYVLVGRAVRPRELSPVWIVPAALVGSVQFFLVTNFLVWPGSTVYPQTLAGLMECYAAGLPFFRPTIISDVVFSLTFFALHAALVRGVAPAGAEEQPA